MSNIGWKLGHDERGKCFIFMADGVRVPSVPVVYHDVLDRVTPLQRGLLFFNSIKAINAYAPAEDQDRLLLSTYAMAHTISDDPEATIPLSRL